MIKMSIHKLDRKVTFVAQLAHHIFTAEFLLKFTAIAIVNFFFWYFLQSIASKMKTGITGIAIQNLIGLVIEATKAYFAISLKHFFVIGICTFCWAYQFLILNEGVEHLHGFIRMTMLEIFQYRNPHEIFFYLGDL